MSGGKKRSSGKSAVMANENPTAVPAGAEESLLSKPGAVDVNESQADKLSLSQNGQSDTLNLTKEVKVDKSKLSQAEAEGDNALGADGVDGQDAEGDNAQGAGGDDEQDGEGDDAQDAGGDDEQDGDGDDEVASELPESIAESAKDFFTQHSEETAFYATEDGNFFFERDQHLAKHHAHVSKIRLFVLNREQHG